MGIIRNILVCGVELNILWLQLDYKALILATIPCDRFKTKILNLSFLIWHKSSDHAAWTLAIRAGFMPLGQGLNHETGVWTLRLRFRPQGWEWVLDAEVKAARHEFGP